MKQAKTTAAAFLAIAITFVAGTAAETAEQRAMREAEAAAAQAKADAEWAAYEAERAEKAAKEKEASAKAAAKPAPAPNRASGGSSVVPGNSSEDISKYKTVKIGNQTWMAENLNYNASGSKCYDNKPENCQKYGRLYDWETAMKVCPKGWHLPTDSEWTALMDAVGGIYTAGKHLKSKSGWNDYRGKSGNGEDTHGFAALPGGIDHLSGKFEELGSSGIWWCATESDRQRQAYLYGLHSHEERASRFLQNNRFFNSVRCIKD